MNLSNDSATGGFNSNAINTETVCPHCSAFNITGQKFCGTCGKPLMSGVVCEKCGKVNHEGQAFCGNCGTKLVKKCLSCGKENAPLHKFCGDCGKQL